MADFEIDLPPAKAKESFKLDLSADVTVRSGPISDEDARAAIMLLVDFMDGISTRVTGSKVKLQGDPQMVRAQIAHLFGDGVADVYEKVRLLYFKNIEALRDGK